MKRGQLRDYFRGVGVKRLSAVDAELKRSNQHEVNTTHEMVTHFLGEARRQDNPTVYIWLGQEQDAFTVKGTATHYDTRVLKPERTPEWRLYYRSNPVTVAMREGDTLFLAMDRKELLYFIVAPAGSTSEQQLFWLFDLKPHGRSFVSRGFLDADPKLDFATRYILDEIGIEFEEPDIDKLDNIIERFGSDFPNTAKFSQLARLTLPEVRAEEDPDAALVAWLSHEEALFRRIERRAVSARLREGFADDDGADVDGFIQFSLSVQNRRKSRMGYSLEHHLEAVFQAYEIPHVRQAVTENNQKPDFLFPSVEAYQVAPVSGSPCLTMLGAKSTCKDRWRQVLAEAAKIPRKHLLTLEPGISESQTDQMCKSNLQLVIPQSIQETYSDKQRTWLWNLGDFIRDVETRLRE